MSTDALQHSELIARLRQQAEDVVRMTGGFSDPLLERRTVPDKWSLSELTCHLLQVQELFESRLDAMLQRDDPAFGSYSPESDPGFADLVAAKRGHDAVRAFVAAREAFARRLEALEPASWRRTATHPTFGRFDVEFLLEYLVLHEAHHLFQIFQRRIPLLENPPE